jgi:hypothetical protein
MVGSQLPTLATEADADEQPATRPPFLSICIVPQAA